MKEEAVEGNCWASQDPSWVVELLQKKREKISYIFKYNYLNLAEKCEVHKDKIQACSGTVSISLSNQGLRACAQYSWGSQKKDK
jgi:hypothetical protein